MSSHPSTRIANLLRRSQNLDRFIPNRAAMDFDFASYMLMEARNGNGKENPPALAKQPYQKQLAQALNLDRTRILTFKDKPPLVLQSLFFPEPTSRPVKPPRRTIPQTCERTLSAPDMPDDYSLNLLDWSNSNVIAIALGTTVYLWDASASSDTSQVLPISEDEGPITSVNWAPDGRQIAVGFDNSDVQLWDSVSIQRLRTLRGCTSGSRVTSLAWNDNHVLTTGGTKDIVNNDMRIGDHIVQRYQGHRQEVCALKWSPSGHRLASGGTDNLVHIWDRKAASSNSSTRCLHRFRDHTAAIRALAWCPFQTSLLASGGGGGDHCINFWNTQTGASLNSIDTASEVCSLLWNQNERQLLSSHGFNQNQLTLWKYPSMLKIAQLTGHTKRVLYSTQSPDACSVATAAGDESLRIWNVFGTPGVAAKPASKTKPEPFANANRIR